MKTFIYGIMKKWYLMIAVPSIVVVYFVLQGLTKTGILQAAEEVVTEAVQDTKSIAQHCVPKILNIGAFWDCLQNPPEYEVTTEERELEQELKQYVNKSLDLKNYKAKGQDPYEQQ